ncbi:MAG: response regulator [Anaerolineae bacterium]
MAETTMATPQATVLVVEDDPNIRDIVAMILSDAGYRVLKAGDGGAALALVQQERPALIVSDVKMPGLDGFGLCEQIRADRDLAQIPFIFLTASDEHADVRRGMVLGADDYLTKPFEADELVAAVQVRLARAAEAQAAIDRASANLQDSIVRSLTHEFRTPLALVAGYTDLLESDGQALGPDEFDQVLRGLHSGSARLMSLVEDFLLLNQLEAGVVAREAARVPFQPIVPDPIIKRAVARAQAAAQARHVHLATDCRTADVMVAICPDHLAQIAARLVDNACKFSKPEGGRVAVSTRCLGDRWQLSVADQGIGIPAEALDWIFEAFRQVDRARLEQQGSGVGLTIVRGLAEVYGGQVSVESTPGKGSIFALVLPVAEFLAPEPARGAAATGAGGIANLE